MGFTKSELLMKASQAATEYVNEEMIFLDPEVYWELKDPHGSLECYFYYEDKYGNTRAIIVQASVNGAIISTHIDEDPLGKSLFPDRVSRKERITI
ncbi:MAG: hypothetical protein ACFFD4_12795 [Candidatus Odinarchaeota archaeon]